MMRLCAIKSHILRQAQELSSQRRPQSTWKPGENQPIPFNSGAWNGYDPKDLQQSGGLYGLLISSVVPRPIALVTSQDQHGALNCAPFSYFNVVCHDPPTLMVSCNLNGRNNTKKDTLVNIEATGIGCVLKLFWK